MVAHIKDVTSTVEAEKIGAPSSTADKQVFHTDAGDIVSLLCLSPSAEGGESYLSSSWNVYNILAKERPDLIHTLSQDWPNDGYAHRSDFQMFRANGLLDSVILRSHILFVRFYITNPQPRLAPNVYSSNMLADYSQAFSPCLVP